MKKICKLVKMYQFLICSYKSQDLAQSQEILRGRKIVRP